MFNSIKNALFVADPNAPATPAVKPVTTGGNPAPLQPAGSAPLLSTDPRESRSYIAIRTAVMSRITAYSSLIKASEKLVAIIPDPVQRLRAAQATSNEGRTVAQLADAVAIHLADIDNETLKFKAAIESRRESTISALRSKKANAENLINSGNQELERLNARIQELQQNVSRALNDAASVDSEIAAADSELNASISDFTFAANTLREELTVGKNTILTSLN